MFSLLQSTFPGNTRLEPRILNLFQISSEKIFVTIYTRIFKGAFAITPTSSNIISTSPTFYRRLLEDIEAWPVS